MYFLKCWTVPLSADFISVVLDVSQYLQKTKVSWRSVERIPEPVTERVSGICSTFSMELVLRVLQWWVPRPLPCPSADPALKPVCQGERAHSWAHTALTTPAPPLYLWTWTPFTNWLDHCVHACVTASVYMQSRHIYNVTSLCLSTRSSPGVCACVCQCACEETVAVRSCSLKGSAAKTFLL